MRNKSQQKMKQCFKRGLDPMTVAYVHELAKKEAAKMQEEATMDAFLFMLAIPLNVLVHDYWPKTAKRRAPEFIREVTKLYEAVAEGVVTREELNDLLYDYAKMRVTEEVLVKYNDEK